MVGKAIELQGGFEWVIDKGDNVYIKINLVGGDSPYGCRREYRCEGGEGLNPSHPQIYRRGRKHTDC